MQLKHYVTKLMLGTAFVITGIGGAYSAEVQQSQSAPTQISALEEVTVTARRVSESLQEVPVAVTALSGEAIEKLGIRSIYDLKTAVPGMLVATANTHDSLVVGIRGQRNSQVQPGQDPAIGVYFADVPTGFQFGMNLGMFDLSNVQVLKGPQGTLFGRNSTGGAILFSPNKPTDQFEGSVRVGVVGYNGGSGITSTSVLNIPINDTLALRVGLNTVNRSGYLENIADPALVDAIVPPNPLIPPWPGGKATLKHLGAQDSQEWRVGLSWTPSSNFENYTVYDGVNYRSNGIAPRIVGINTANPIPVTGYQGTNGPVGPLGPVLERFEAHDNFWATQVGLHLPLAIDQHRIVNTSTLTLGDITLKNIFGWKTIHRRWSSSSIGVPYHFIESYYRQNGYEFSEELQIEGKSFENSLEWVAGFFYFNNRLYQNIEGAAITYSSRISDANNLTWAGYAQATYHMPFLDGLSVTGGLRYTADSRKLANQSYTQRPQIFENCRLAPVPPDCVAVGKKGFGKWTYTGTLTYQYDAATMSYFTVSSGYRAGGYNVSEGNPERYALGYLPESVRNYELGLKRDWQLGSVPMRTNLAGYIQKYTNIVRQAQNPNDPRFALLVNATQATIRGGEAEIQIIPIEALTLSASYSYVDAYYTGPFIVGGRDIRGNKFALVPATTLSLNAAYTLPFDASVGTVVFSTNYYLQSRMWFDDNNQGPNFGPRHFQSSAPYGVLDMRLDWERVNGSNFDISLWSKNLSNSKYYTSMVPLYGSMGVSPAFAGQPRFVGIDVKYHIGG